MKKLTLNINDLRVETFDPEAEAFGKPGSVEAFEALPTYDPRDIRCAYSRPLEPGDVCTPVCIPSARCVLTEDPAEC